MDVELEMSQLVDSNDQIGVVKLTALYRFLRCYLSATPSQADSYHTLFTSFRPIILCQLFPRNCPSNNTITKTDRLQGPKSHFSCNTRLSHRTF
jgi:hypothetical protein